MGIAITDAHRELERVADDLLASVGARAANRALLESRDEGLPPFWEKLREVGWLGLHLPESHGGSGYGLQELVVVVEAIGRAAAPGPFVPTVIASGAIAAAGTEDQRSRWLPELADGRRTGAFGFGEAVSLAAGTATGPAGLVLGGALADAFVVVAGDDLVVLDRAAPGVHVRLPENIDHARRSVLVDLEGAAVDAVVGGARAGRAVARTVLAAEAAGGAQECCRAATAYAGERQQFGRIIGTFQAVKHHCADMAMAAELAVAACWDAAAAADRADLDQLELAAAVAAMVAAPAFLGNSHLNIQVHGGIGFTWEHDAHLLMRRAIALSAALAADDPVRQVLASARAGVVRSLALELPPEAEQLRAEVRAFADEVATLDPESASNRLIETGYLMPHWPRPWGRSASAVEQLVIDEELERAGVERPDLGIAAWVVLTLIQHGTDEQVERWVLPALRRERIWCQLFSEPEAGSDAAAARTRAERTDGGWIVNGQKVWTSGGDTSHLGLATVRTDPSAPKHKGLSTFVVDMHAPGVEVRPLRQVDGATDFTEVFLTDVFVPDADVVGEIDQGWTVARATLGNERVSIGAGAGGGLGIDFDWIELLDADPARSAGVAPQVARLLAIEQAQRLLDLRRAARAVAGGEPGPEGALTKLVLAELSHARGELGMALTGGAAAFLEGAGGAAAMTSLRTRAMSIAGGTSEITRNQIGERLLGLPRDPLLQ